MTKALTTKTNKQSTVASMDALHDIVMQTLQGTLDGTMDLDRAKAINALVQTGLNGAKIASDYMHRTQRTHSAFFEPNALPHTTHLTSDAEPASKKPGSHWQGLTRA